MRLSSRKALLAGVAGTALQWYEFALFGYFAPLISATYFPNDNQFASLLSTFGIFAVGYLLAPLGSLFFGYLGDTLGRKPALILSILAMAIPTALMSIVPSYQLIGIAAPLLITFLRMIQGFVAHSEFTGSAIFLVEHASSQQKALYGCLTSSAYSIGAIVAGLVASFLTASFMPSWGWRIGFALALLAAILIYKMRANVAETPVYQQIIPHRSNKFPLLIALNEAPYAIAGVMGITWLIGIMTYGTYVFTATYFHLYFNMSLATASLVISLSLVVDAVLEPFIAMVADRIGLVKIIRLGMLGLGLLSLPLFCLIASGNTYFILLGMTVFSVLIAITYAPLNAYMVSLFPSHYRYSGFGMAFNLGISLFGGTTPLVMIWLINKTDNLISPAWYYMVGALIGLISLGVCEYSRRTIKPSLDNPVSKSLHEV